MDDVVEQATQQEIHTKKTSQEAAQAATLNPPADSQVEKSAAPPPEATPQKARTTSFASMLIEAGVLSEEQVLTAQEAARREKLPLWRILVRDGLVMSQELVALTALHLGLTMVDLRNQSIDTRAVLLIPEKVARKHVVLPVQESNGHLTVAMTDPTDLQLFQSLSARTGCVIDPVVATPEDIFEHIDISYRLAENAAGQATGEKETSGSKVTSKFLRDMPSVQIIDHILQQAIQDRASDIHIEPAEARLRVRYRIDGILHDRLNLPQEMHPSIISRIKIMSGLNIAERRRPQDGQFTVEIQNRKVDVRVAVSNTINGEMVVLRLLDKQFTLIGLNQLGMSPKGIEQYKRMLRLPYGIIIVCGPTGAGKSTTLYASVLQMNRIEHNVISVEDPVEYHMGDVNQIQVHPEVGVTFATQLRSILRLDPNIILVGEIRDQETANIAIQASLTGHLVLTSLHANDSVSALIRLKDLGVPPYLIASAVAGVVAQRMVRVVCNSCQTMMRRPLAEQKAYTSVLGEQQEQFVYGTGCNMCSHTGYRGRTGVYEVLTMSDSLRSMFLSGAARDQVWEQALKEGLVPLVREGMLKIKAGITTPYEVMRVLFTLDY